MPPSSYFDDDSEGVEDALASLPLPPHSLSLPAASPRHGPLLSSPSQSASPLVSLPTFATSALASTVPSPRPASSNDITADSEHHFSTKALLLGWIEEYARLRGFAIRNHSSGGGVGKYSGYFACHCEQEPSASRPSISRGGTGTRIHCGCKWRVNYSKVQARTEEEKDDYHLTDKRFLHHTGHSPQACDPSAKPHFTSLRDIPADIRSFIVVMLQCNLLGEPRVKRYVETLHACTFDDSTFHNLFNQCKEVAQVAHPTEDFTVLFQWLLHQIAQEKGAYARLCLDGEVTNELNGVIYLSADMVHNLARNGTLLIMDTTFKTNRFNWPLLLVCGINEHHHTVLFAVALLRYQTTAMFAWALEQMRLACGDEGWSRVRCVATDGDKAMSAAIAVLPSTRHLRCWYHIEQNMRHRFVTLGPLTSEDFDVFLRQWKDAASKEEEVEFQVAQGELHSAYPALTDYLTEHIWPNGDAFLQCRTKSSTTLGVLSTQRVESFNSVLKTHFAVGSRTPLVNLFGILQYAAMKADRVTIAEMQRQDLVAAQHARTGAFADIVGVVLSRWAADKVREQYDFIHSFDHEPDAPCKPTKVWSTTAATRREREVFVDQCTMKCSCGFPITYLLPCRHVLYLNLVIHRRPFIVEQVGQRWLRSFMPSVNYAPNPLLAHVQQVPQPSPLISVRLPAKELTAQQRYTACERFGQDVGRIAAPHKQRWPEVEARCAAFLKDIERLVGSDNVVSQPPPDPSQFAIGPLHATVPVECIPHPILPNALPGRTATQRTKSKGEAGQRKRHRDETVL
jgi:hypothetical protein